MAAVEVKYISKNEELVKRRIEADLKDHVITAIHACGMHRHYRCQKPGTWCMGFDVVTWPGSLCFTGDMGDFLFQRTEDMIAFMRGSCMSYGYAAEKCVAHDGRLREWSEELFRKALDDRLKDFDEDDGQISIMRQGRIRKESVAEKVKEIIAEFSEYSDRHSAEKAMYESGLFDGCDMPNCEEYTFRFLWCLHAMKWFCANVGA